MANKQTEYEYSLDDLLRNSPPGSFDLSEEDQEWLDMTPVGKEFGSTSADDE